MKNRIQDSAVDAISEAIVRSIPNVVREAVEQFNEECLVKSVRASNGTDREKVMLYLQNTEQNCTKLGGTMLVRVHSEEVREKLAIHPHQMKPLREALAAEGQIRVPEITKGPFEIIYWRPRPATTTNAASQA
jgi:hypothetical protein